MKKSLYRVKYTDKVVTNQRKHLITMGAFHSTGTWVTENCSYMATVFVRVSIGVVLLYLVCY